MVKTLGLDYFFCVPDFHANDHKVCLFFVIDFVFVNMCVCVYV